MLERDGKAVAIPKKWLVPIRLAGYSALAGCSAFVYFNVGDLELTHYLVIVSIVAVTAMVLLDCRFSDDYWRRQERQESNNKSQT